MNRIACAALLLTAATATGQTTQPGRATPAGAAAAEMLHRHAQDLLLTGEAPARSARRRATLEMARRLAPNDPSVARDLAGLYLTLARRDDQVAVLETYLAAHPSDYAVGLDWLRARRGMLHTAEQRIAFFQDVASREGLGPALRAEALAQIAGIRARQGRWTSASEAATAALQLDAHNGEAIDMHLQANADERGPTAAQRVEGMLAKLAGRPVNVDGAMTLANLLHALQRPDEAARFYRHAHQVLQRIGSPRTDAINGLCDALLDAGKPGAVVELLSEDVSQFGNPRPLQLKLIEAYRRQGNVGKAEEVLAALAEVYRKQEPTAALSPATAMEVAWFYLVHHERPKLALAFAQHAYERRFERGAPERRGGPTALLGAAQIAAGQADKGVQRLEPLLDEDPFAGVFLAEHRFAAGDTDGGRQAVREALALTHGGWAYRRLRDLAQEHDVTVPTPPDSAAAARAVATFDFRRLAPATRPGDFMAIALKPIRAEVPCGEPVRIEAVLSNTGDVPITLGADALLAPRMALRVTAGEVTVDFTDPPDVVWAAPRRLPPGKEIRTTVTLDAGPVGRQLRRAPLRDMTITVTALPGPVVRSGELHSSVPGLAVEPLRLKRVSLLQRVNESKRSDPPEAYREVLGWIVYDLKREPLAARMRAARQVASLLGLARQMELGQTGPPEALRDAVDKAVLLRMCREVLNDRSPAVRAQLLVALGDVRLDASILKRIAPAASDDTPLVRLCMAELIGASRTRGRQTLIDYLAQDRDPLVAQMASALNKARR
ncbi:MAG: hypothetical protein KGY99_04600 [Phycisphaerae bacterium]|nr:hypothetical protein [Phycisphaerae bacterium]